MKKFIALTLVCLLCIPLQIRVLADEGGDYKPTSLSYSDQLTDFSSVVTLLEMAGLTLSLGYTVYRIYNSISFNNKIINIVGDSASGDSLGMHIDPRDDLTAQLQARRLLIVTIPELKGRSNVLDARHLANLVNLFPVIILNLQQRMDLPQARELADDLDVRRTHLIRLMNVDKSIKVKDLVNEIKEIDKLLKKATQLIDQYVCKKHDGLKKAS